MKIIFHVGMGKTGTSSIQAALANSQSQLSAHNIEYIGLWLTTISPGYRGYAGFDAFCNQSEVDIKNDAEKFFDRLSARGVETFIYSNESMFSNVYSFHPFIERLIELGAKVEVVIYMRQLVDWLPSAFVQWNSFHKAHRGPIRSFPDKGRELAALYNNALVWLDLLGNIVNIRTYKKGENILSDFSEFIGCKLDSPEDRIWERTEDTETVLRSIFNDRVEAPALPDLFENVMRLSRNQKIRSVEEFASKALDFSAMPEILKENSRIADEIRRRTGIDILEEGSKNTDSSADVARIRERLIDFLIELSISQSMRLQRLEDTVAKLSGGA